MTERPFFSRRRFMACASLAALAQAGAPLRFAVARQENDLSAFLALSESATGHARLDPDLAQAILAAFRTAGAADDLAAVAPETDSPARRALLKAWYLGRVGPDGVRDPEGDDVSPAGGEAAGGDDGGDDAVVGFEATLMGRVVADLIPLRSYCGGRPHFWAEPPDDPDLRRGVEP